MSAIPDGVAGVLLLIALFALFHESWRWAGLWLSRELTTDSAVFRWVQLVATALVAGLVLRLIVFPAGALESVSAFARVGAMAAGIAVYLASGRRLFLGVTAGMVAMLGLAAIS
ncbi:MAG: AzlD domain-containing protein [Pseudomonadota bacterium]